MKHRPFIERLNLFLRRAISYLQRRTTRKVRRAARPENALEILRLYYNSIRRHSCLRFGKVTRTPAMQAGLFDRPLSFRMRLGVLRRPQLMQHAPELRSSHMFHTPRFRRMMWHPKTMEVQATEDGVSEAQSFDGQQLIPFFYSENTIDCYFEGGARVTVEALVQMHDGSGVMHEEWAYREKRSEAYSVLVQLLGQTVSSAEVESCGDLVLNFEGGQRLRFVWAEHPEPCRLDRWRVWGPGSSCVQ